ncbi:MAG: hypothetical protein SFU98_12920 [Leptospiraceae bacterium]|nr:hypothetical protein [Leptospiraceae bacterium]
MMRLAPLLITFILNFYCVTPPDEVDHKRSNRNLAFYFLLRSLNIQSNDTFEPNNSFEEAKCLDKTIVDKNAIFRLPYYNSNNSDIDYFYINLEKDKVFIMYFIEESGYIIDNVQVKFFDKNFSSIGYEVKKSSFAFSNVNSKYFQTEINPSYTGKYFLTFENKKKEGQIYFIKVLPNTSGADFFFSYANSCDGN